MSDPTPSIEHVQENPEQSQRHPDRDTDSLGLRAIVGYKAVKGALEIAFAIVLLGILLTGHAHSIEWLANGLRHHVSGAWAVRSAAALLRLATPRHVELTAVALLLDGLLSGVEGWALHTRRWWAEWLVVVASGTPLPYEAFELVAHPRIGRAVLIVVNLVVVVYLARRALRRGRTE